VVRAHPTVPLPLLFAGTWRGPRWPLDVAGLGLARRFLLQPDARLLLLLANPPSFTHTSRFSAWGIHVRHCRKTCGYSFRSAAGNGVFSLDLARGGLGLHRRTAASLFRRCFPAVRRGHPRCRPGHGLHGQATSPAQSRLPDLLHGRPAGRTCGFRKTSQYQAGAHAKATQAQETT